MRVALAGPMGVGKTTIGRLLSARLGVPFVDLDDEIAARFGPIPALFAAGGEPHFRACERAALAEAVAGEGVLALGGGTVVDPASRAALAGWRVFVLDAPVEALVARVGDDPSRPLAASLPALVAARAGAYAAAGERVPVGGLVPQAAAAVIEARLLEGLSWTLSVGGAQPYPVTVIGGWAGLAAAARPALEGRSVLLLADERVWGLHGAAVEAALAGVAAQVVVRTLPAGEDCKQIPVWASMVEAALEAGADRRWGVVSLGGGAASDLAGFVAATLLRGVAFLPLPTTLLAMVDASVGGKVAVDVPQGKNLVGAFHPPIGVIAALAALETLPEVELRAGLGEVVKHAVLRGEAALARCEALAGAVAAAGGLAALPKAALLPLIQDSIACKAAVVAADPTEQGVRVTLNLGHTLGHAVEQAALEAGEPLPHGEAVAIGLAAVLRWGVRQHITPAEVATRVVTLLKALGLRTSIPINLSRERIARALRFDKKRQRGMLQMVLVRGLGEVEAQLHPLQVGVELIECGEEGQG